MIFSSVDALKTTAGTVDKELCQVLGYGKPGDGGGGIFFWDAGSGRGEDDGIVFWPNNLPTGRWIRNTDGNIINVKWSAPRNLGAVILPRPTRNIRTALW